MSPELFWTAVRQNLQKYRLLKFQPFIR